MAIHDYEMTLIVDSQLQESDETVKRYEDLLSDQGANLVNTDRWGGRKLAYDIKKRQQGDYTLVQFQAEPASIAEVDRICRLDEAVLRHLIIQVGKLPPSVEEVEGSDSEGEQAEDEAEADGESTDEDTQEEDL